MAESKKKLAIVAAVLMLSGLTFYFGARVVIGKYLNSPETRKEIENIITAGFSGILARPGVSIERVTLLGLSGITLEKFQIMEAGQLLLESNRTVVGCSIIKQLLLGSCNLEFEGDFGPDGIVNLAGKLPRAALFADQSYRYNTSAKGKLSGLNVGKLLRGSGQAGQGLSVAGAVIDGTFELQVAGQWVPKIKAKFKGNIEELVIGLNMNGNRKQRIDNTPLEFQLADNKIELARPLKLSLFGMTLNYKGGFKLDNSVDWSGAFEVSGGSMLARYFPRVLKCRTIPRNPGKFTIEGSFEEPVCR